MGYYTYFEIRIKKDKQEDAFKKRLEEISDYKFYSSSEKDINSKKQIKHFAIDDTVKWSNHDDDMIKLSEEFPKILIQVDGDGEGSDDIWRTYYLNGKYQSVEVKTVYGKVNMKKLKGEE